MYLIIGLGNPGKEYENTRHNAGFKVIDLLAEKNDIAVKKVKFDGLMGDGTIGGKRAILFKPMTYMNNSGIPTLNLFNFYKTDIEKVILIYDDIDIPFGTIKIKKKGSSGTHNGMKSIIYHLMDDNFPRIKVGLGKPDKQMNLANYVLGVFSEKEEKIFNKEIEYAASACECILKEDIDCAMNKFNGLNFIEE